MPLLFLTVVYLQNLGVVQYTFNVKQDLLNRMNSHHTYLSHPAHSVYIDLLTMIGLNWTFNQQPAFNGTVEFSNGSVVELARRERYYLCCLCSFMILFNFSVHQEPTDFCILV